LILNENIGLMSNAIAVKLILYLAHLTGNMWTKNCDILGSTITNLPRAGVYPSKKVKLGYAVRIFKKSVKINRHINLHSFTLIRKRKRSAIVSV
jgi:hypothetical protein